jgi:hypothetical protein
VPLQLGVDESYSLDIPDDGSDATLSAVTVWGALRGLETFSQIIQHQANVDQPGFVKPLHPCLSDLTHSQLSDAMDAHLDQR